MDLRDVPLEWYCEMSEGASEFSGFMLRGLYAAHIKRLFESFPVVALVGPRQCGKTTLALEIGAAENPVFEENRFDLESPSSRARLENPEQALGPLRGLVVIDEIQHQPDLFPLLRVLADRPGTPARFLIPGSASPWLIKGVSESLAGRVAMVEMGGFDLTETGSDQWRNLWLRGGFPRSYLASSDAASFEWREQFVQTFLTLDLPQLGITIPPPQMRRFWIMMAHYHAQTWNSSEIAGSLGISDKTARHYLDILTGAFMVRQLLPWTENVGKRLRRAPKVYLRDSGIFHSLMGMPGWVALESNPKLGASWEGFALEQTLRAWNVPNGEAFYWSVHNGPEMDLLLFRGGKRIGVEFKFADAPVATRSMQSAKELLHLDRVIVIYPGTARYPMGDEIEALPIAAMAANPPEALTAA